MVSYLNMSIRFNQFLGIKTWKEALRQHFHVLFRGAMALFTSLFTIFISRYLLMHLGVTYQLTLRVTVRLLKFFNLQRMNCYTCPTGNYWGEDRFGVVLTAFQKYRASWKPRNACWCHLATSSQWDVCLRWSEVFSAQPLRSGTRYLHLGLALSKVQQSIHSIQVEFDKLKFCRAFRRGSVAPTQFQIKVLSRDCERKVLALYE